jgi:hypothetical protein
MSRKDCHKQVKAGVPLHLIRCPHTPKCILTSIGGENQGHQLRKGMKTTINLNNLSTVDIRSFTHNIQLHQLSIEAFDTASFDVPWDDPEAVRRAAQSREKEPVLAQRTSSLSLPSLSGQSSGPASFDVRKDDLEAARKTMFHRNQMPGRRPSNPPFSLTRPRAKPSDLDSNGVLRDDSEASKKDAASEQPLGPVSHSETTVQDGRDWAKSLRVEPSSRRSSRRQPAEAPVDASRGDSGVASSSSPPAKAPVRSSLRRAAKTNPQQPSRDDDDDTSIDWDSYLKDQFSRLASIEFKCNDDIPKGFHPYKCVIKNCNSKHRTFNAKLDMQNHMSGVYGITVPKLIVENMNGWCCKSMIPSTGEVCTRRWPTKCGLTEYWKVAH